MNRKSRIRVKIGRRVLSGSLNALNACAVMFVVACGTEGPFESEPLQPAAIESVEQAIGGGTLDNTNQLNTTVKVTDSNGTCSGTLITNSWVLTANHCVAFPPPADVTVTLAAGTVGQQQQSVPVANIVRVPCNVPNSPQCHDALLLKTSNPFTINGSTTGYVRSQYPLSSASLNDAGRTILQIGWGGTSGIQTFANLDPLRVDVNATNPTATTVPIGDMVRWTCTPLTLPCTVPGDSGGGGFVTLNGKTFQATVAAGAHDFSVPPNGVNDIGESFVLATSTPTVRSWLDKNLYSAGGNIFSVSASSGGVAASTRGANKLDLFWVDTSGNVQVKYYNSGWSLQASLGKPTGRDFTGRPASVSWNSARMDVFARATDNTLWHRFYDGATWGSGWSLIASNITSSPAVASWGSNRLDLFARASDNTLWHKWYHSGWGTGESLGGVLTSAPAAVSWASGRIDVIVRGGGNSYYHKYYENGWGPSQTGFNNVGGNFTGDPGLASWGPGRLDIFGRGSDGKTKHLWFDGTWLDTWTDMDITQPNCGTSAVSWGPGRVDIFTCNAGSLWQSYFPRP